MIVWSSRAVIALAMGEELMASCSLCEKQFNIIRHLLVCPFCHYQNDCLEIANDDEADVAR